MKAGIHPENYRKVIFKDMSNGYAFLTGSAVDTKEKGIWEDAIEDNPFQQDTRVAVLRPVTKKPLTATDEELRRNSRSRSAKLRVAEKI